jgi:hypothetical protein
MAEIKKINGFPGYYISSDGIVYSDIRTEKVKENNGKPYPVKFKQQKTGYVEVGLYNHETVSNKWGRQWFRVHKLVALHFISDKPSPNYTINHKNGIRNDNRVENIEWMTLSENILHSYYTLNRKPLVRPIYWGDTEYRSITELSSIEGFPRASVNSSLSRMKTQGKCEITYKGKKLRYKTDKRVKHEQI